MAIPLPGSQREAQGQQEVLPVPALQELARREQVQQGLAPSRWALPELVRPELVRQESVRQKSVLLESAQPE